MILKHSFLLLNALTVDLVWVLNLVSTQAFAFGQTSHVFFVVQLCVRSVLMFKEWIQGSGLAARKWSDFVCLFLCLGIKYLSEPFPVRALKECCPIVIQWHTNLCYIQGN